MAQERALTCPASLFFHRHCSWANLLAELMNVHRLWEENGDRRSCGNPISHLSVSNSVLHFRTLNVVFWGGLKKKKRSFHSSQKRPRKYRLINQRGHLELTGTESLPMVAITSCSRVHLITSDWWHVSLCNPPELEIKLIYYHGHIYDPLVLSEEPPAADKPVHGKLRQRRNLKSCVSTGRGGGQVIDSPAGRL